MTAYEKVLDTLEILEVPIVTNHYGGQKRSYMIFKTISEKDGFVTDNDGEGEITHFFLTHWQDGSFPDLSRKIKKLLKENGFRILDKKGTYDDGFHGTIFECQVIIWNHELDED